MTNKQRSRLDLRMARSELTQLRRMAKRAGVTLSQLVNVIVVLEIQELSIAQKKKK